MSSPGRSRHAPARPTTLSGRLDLEWERRRRRRSDVERARSWRITRVQFADLDQLLVELGHGRPSHVDHDAALRALLAIARDDELAALVALRRITPGLLASVRRRAGRSFHAEGRTDVFEELVGAAWITIRTYDLARRPACLPAALIAGAEHRAWRAAARRRSADERPIDPTTTVELADPDHRCADDELAEVLRDASWAGLDDEVRFARQYLDARSTDALADVLGVSPRTVRNRRASVTRRLRQVAVAG